MIPKPDQLEVISHMKSGDLAKTPYPVLLHALAVHRLSVILEIERKQLRKRISIEDGVPVDCRSNLLQDTLGQFMVARGDITEEQCQLSFSKSITRDQLMGEVLISEGLITASELFKTLQQHLAKKLLDGFTWRSGSFQVLSELGQVESSLKVKPAQLVVTGISKLASAEEVEEAARDLAGSKLVLHPSPHCRLDEIRLSGEQRKVAELLQGGKRLEELVEEAKVPRERVARLLYALAVIGTVIPEEWLPKDVAKARVSTSSTQQIAPVTPLPKVEAADELGNALMEKYLRYRKQDPFDLLDIPTDAKPRAIELSYLEFSRKFAPWRFQAAGLEKLVEKAQDLFIAGGRAFGELTDPERRNSLIARRQNLIADRQGQHANGRDQFAIQTDLLDSDVQFKKGQALMLAGNHKEALEQLEFAYDCDPQNGLYRTELAYCRYLREPDFAARKSLQELAEALRIDPNCGLAVYYTGKIHTDLGNADEAETFLRQSIKMMTPDRRPIEALKDLAAQKQVTAKPGRRLF